VRHPDRVAVGEILQQETAGALHPQFGPAELTLPGGDRIVAIVTEGSVKSLALAVGQAAIAYVKAPWVIVLAGEPADRSTGAGAGAPAAAGAAAAAAAAADIVPLDPAATTDTAEEGPSTEESSPESAPRKGGIFRRIRGN